MNNDEDDDLPLRFVEHCASKHESIDARFTEHGDVLRELTATVRTFKAIVATLGSILTVSGSLAGGALVWTANQTVNRLEQIEYDASQRDAKIVASLEKLDERVDRAVASQLAHEAAGEKWGEALDHDIERMEQELREVRRRQERRLKE